MSCQRCESERVANIGGKCSDRCGYSIGSKEDDGYVPEDMGVGGGDYLRISFCLDCGQIQGEFPLPLTEIESRGSDDSDDEESEDEEEDEEESDW